MSSDRRSDLLIALEALPLDREQRLLAQESVVALSEAEALDIIQAIETMSKELPDVLEQVEAALKPTTSQMLTAESARHVDLRKALGDIPLDDEQRKVAEDGIGAFSSAHAESLSDGIEDLKAALPSALDAANALLDSVQPKQRSASGEAKSNPLLRVANEQIYPLLADDPRNAPLFKSKWMRVQAAMPFAVGIAALAIAVAALQPLLVINAIPALGAWKYGALLSAVFASLIEYVRLQRSKLQVGPRAIASGKCQSTALVLGLGRTGKSTLVSDLLGFDKTPENVLSRTPGFAFHRGSFATEERGGTRALDLTVAIFHGSSLSQLIGNFVLEQLNPRTDVRYGDIDALVIVVDVFHPHALYVIPRVRIKYEVSKEAVAALEQASGKNTGDFLSLTPEDIEVIRSKGILDAKAMKRLLPYLVDADVGDPKNEYDQSRIDDHLSAWNEGALDAVFGLLTNNLRYVCLWVNKIDRWKFHSDARHLEELRQNFQPLLERIQHRCNGSAPNVKTTVQIVFGSARSRTRATVNEFGGPQEMIGIDELRSALAKHAKRGDKKG